MKETGGEGRGSGADSGNIAEAQGEQAGVLVSVIIPVFNSAAYISETLDSIAAQTHKDTEIIVVDDGSKDDTVGIVQDYVNHTGINCRIIENSKKKGAAGARNTGIDAASGDHIAFIDADDKWLPEKLEKQTAFMGRTGAAFTFTAYEFADEKCRGMGKIARVPESIDYKAALKNTTIFTSTVILDMHKLSKSDIYFPYIASEDSANWWKILKKTGKAYGIDEALTLYRRSGRTLSSNKLVGIKRIWGLYMNEGLSIPYSLYCFMCFAFNAVKRRV